MCTFADFNRPKLHISTNFQQKHCIGEQFFFCGNGAHKYCPPYTSDVAWGFTTDLEIIYPKCAHSQILTQQNWIFAPIYSKSTAL